MHQEKISNLWWTIAQHPILDTPKSEIGHTEKKNYSTEAHYFGHHGWVCFYIFAMCLIFYFAFFTWFFFLIISTSHLCLRLCVVLVVKFLCRCLLEADHYGGPRTVLKLSVITTKYHRRVKQIHAVPEFYLFTVNRCFCVSARLHNNQTTCEKRGASRTAGIITSLKFRRPVLTWKV